MTVCIAAACEEGIDEPRIILCRDWRSEVPNVGSSDKQLKFRNLSREWVALLAGNVSKAEELCIRFEKHLKTTKLTEDNLADEARKVFHAYKEALADSWLKTTYGFSFRHLIDKGREALGEQFTETCLDQISRLTVGAELIIAGFLDTYDYVDSKPLPDPTICAISENHAGGDVVLLEDEYAVIGSGCNAARTMLSVRQQDSATSLMETIYAVYEAKAISETVPGVGETVSIDVMYPGGKILQLSDAGYDRCDELLSRFGLRSTDTKAKAKWFEFKSDYVEPLSTPPSEA
jgi:ATP-dependent protease HslVU (ClpYQ) peptidase subunit